MTISLPELVEEYKTLFIAPYASHRWASCVARTHWSELEGWQDARSGPVSNIVERGGCEYVYARHDWYFIAVHDPSSSRTALLKWHTQLVAGVETFTPQTPGEVEDLEYMHSVVAGMRELVDQACAIEQARWPLTRQAAPKPKTFVTLQSLGGWTPIRDCPGRFLLRGMTRTLSLHALFGADVPVQEFRSPLARDPIFVAALADGGLISYAHADGTWVHTLGNEEGFRRKLAQLQIIL